MSLHGDLLEQAKHLAKKETKRPKQASLRRAVSAAYYALFHHLIDASSRFAVRGGNREALRNAVTRAFDHGEMKKAAGSFAGGGLPALLHPTVPTPPGVPAELKRLAQAFVELQQARHEADYDLTRAFTRRDALDFVDRTEQAFKDWRTVEGTPAGDAFLIALLLRSKLDRR